MTNPLPRLTPSTAAARNQVRSQWQRLDDLHDGAGGVTCESVTIPSGGFVSIGGTNVIQTDGSVRIRRPIYQMGNVNFGGGATEAEASTNSTSYTAFAWYTVYLDAEDKTVEFNFQAQQDATYRTYCNVIVGGSNTEDSTGVGSSYETMQIQVDVSAFSAGLYTWKLQIKSANAAFTAKVKGGQLDVLTY